MKPQNILDDSALKARVKALEFRTDVLCGEPISSTSTFRSSGDEAQTSDEAVKIMTVCRSDREGFQRSWTYDTGAGANVIGPHYLTKTVWENREAAPEVTSCTAAGRTKSRHVTWIKVPKLRQTSMLHLRRVRPLHLSSRGHQRLWQHLVLGC